MLGAGIYAYTKDALSSDDWPFPNIDFNLLEEVYWRVSPNATAFSGNFRDDLENSENVTVFLNATATALHADPSGKTVKSATIKEPDGKTATVRARYFIVAAGALESARLLLASQDVMPDGLGNDHDIVGRFFMMHPHVDLGKAVGLDDQMSSYFTDYMQGGAELIPGFRPSVDSQRDNRILNGAITLEPVVDNISGYYSIKRISKDLTRSYRSLRYGVGSPELSDEFGDWVLRALTDIDSTVGGLWKNATDATYEGEYASGIANIYVQAEQAPNPDSRITLSDEADILGVPMLNQDCRVLPIDKRTLVMLGELFGRELGLLNAGRVQLAEWLLDDSVTWDRQMWGGCHHLGTTRMSESATDGVVDANCKLHNIDNTYVASSSVFTTGGYANPTISIVALALRLAEHIQSKES